MYKVDLQTLKEITATLDEFLNYGYIANSGSEIIERIKLRRKAEKLSQKIKDNYTQIKL
jgi:ABC-type sulfate transport system substrate-binding protein